MKKIYITPEFEVVKFNVVDVLTNSSVVTTVPGSTSPGVDFGGTGGDGYIDFDDIL